MLKLLITKTYNFHNITIDTCFILFSVFISLHLLFVPLRYIIFIIYVSLLATLTCFLSVSFHIGHNPKEKLIFEPNREIFWVSALLPANDKDYLGDLPLPLWWIMLQPAFMSQQKKKQSGTYNLETFIFNLLEWPHPKWQRLRSITFCETFHNETVLCFPDRVGRKGKKCHVIDVATRRLLNIVWTKYKHHFILNPLNSCERGLTRYSSGGIVTFLWLLSALIVYD